MNLIPQENNNRLKKPQLQGLILDFLSPDSGAGFLKKNKNIKNFVRKPFNETYEKELNWKNMEHLICKREDLRADYEKLCKECKNNNQCKLNSTIEKLNIIYDKLKEKKNLDEFSKNELIKIIEDIINYYKSFDIKEITLLILDFWTKVLNGDYKDVSKDVSNDVSNDQTSKNRFKQELYTYPIRVFTKIKVSASEIGKILKENKNITENLNESLKKIEVILEILDLISPTKIIEDLKKNDKSEKKMIARIKKFFQRKKDKEKIEEYYKKIEEYYKKSKNIIDLIDNNYNKLNIRSIKNSINKNGYNKTKQKINNYKTYATQNSLSKHISSYNNYVFT